MQAYKLFIFDDDGRVTHHAAFEARDNNAAIATARKLAGDAPAELWACAWLVKRFGPASVSRPYDVEDRKNSPTGTVRGSSPGA